MRDPRSIDAPVDVLIAGAGPVGLFLACELRLAGASVLVLERDEAPSSPLKRLPFGLRGLTMPTVEILDRRGLLDGLAASPAPAGDARRRAGHFAGLPLDPDKVDAARWPFRLPGPADADRAVEIERLEAVLAGRAVALGAEILRGAGVEGFAPSGDGVTVRAGPRSFEARWLVGCDGGRSIVRKAGGFAFVGTDPELTGYSIQVDLADPEKLQLGRCLTPGGMYFQTRPGHFGLVEFDGGAFHRSGPVTLDRAQAVLRRVSRTDATLTALHVGTSWTDRARQATAYRRGRVLLAGDAAHIHSPLGGQGLNLGIGDAANLGWKLAATARGRAPEGLLDTYFAERHPVAARVLDWSRAQVALMRPSPEAQALRTLVGDLMATRDGATFMAERVWNASPRLDLGGCHPLVGRSVPDFASREGTRLASALASGRALLIDFGARAPLRALAERWGEGIAYLAGDAVDRLGLSAVLVRPDGVVAWACEGEPDTGEVVAAASRWLGPPPSGRDRVKGP